MVVVVGVDVVEDDEVTDDVEVRVLEEEVVVDVVGTDVEDDVLIVVVAVGELFKAAWTSAPISLGT